MEVPEHTTMKKTNSPILSSSRTNGTAESRSVNLTSWMRRGPLTRLSTATLSGTIPAPPRSTETQARALIRSCQYTIAPSSLGPGLRIRAIVHLTDTDTDPGGYVFTAKAVNDKDLWTRVVQQAKSDLKALQSKWVTYVSMAQNPKRFAKLLAVLEKPLNQLEKLK